MFCACRPVKLLRLLMVVFYKIFYITAVNFLLGPLNCSWLQQSKVHNSVDFPTQSEYHQCLQSGCV